MADLVDDQSPWRYYDSTAEGYDLLHGEEQRRKVRLIISLLKPSPDWRILDVGCGTGVSMESWPCEVVGVEPSEKMVMVARGKGLAVVIAPAEKLPFPDDSFDVAVAVTSAHHFAPPAFQEMARVAKRAVFSLLKKGRLDAIRREVESCWRIKSEHDCPPDVVWVCERKNGSKEVFLDG